MFGHRINRRITVNFNVVLPFGPSLLSIPVLSPSITARITSPARAGKNVFPRYPTDVAQNMVSGLTLFFRADKYSPAHTPDENGEAADQ